MKNLENKVALVTGAGRGIGQGIALRFAKEGAKVGVLDIETDAVAETVQHIKDSDGNALSLVCDLREPEHVTEAVNQLQEAFGTINVIVNNAAVMPSGRLHETSFDDWNTIFDVNVRGAYLVNRAVIPQMLKAGQGSIIHMASITGTRGLPGIAAYSATKGALMAMTRAMSTDYAKLGIRVNSVAPGTINSPMLHNFLHEQSNPDKLRHDFDEMHPIGRVGTIDEVASVCVFLASDQSSFVTGSNYEVDGGLASKGEQPQD